MKPSIWMDDDKIYCARCELGIPWNIDACPKCYSFKRRSNSVTVTRKGMPRVHNQCLSCGALYNSMTCIRVPYVWYWAQKSQMDGEAAAKTLKGRPLRTEEDRLKMEGPPMPPERIIDCAANVDP
jgi:hypothetical protein